MIVDLLSELLSITQESVYDKFQEGGNADFYTWYMRLLTAGDD